MSRRRLLNAICYVLSTGCQWQALPKDLPPKSTAHYYFMLWDWDGTSGAHPPLALRRDPRSRPDAKQARRRRSLTVRAPRPPQKGALRSTRRGSMQARRSRVRKRHILVDTLGLLLSVIVHPADVQDRDGARQVLRTARRLFPFIECIFADRSDIRGRRWMKVIAGTGCWTLQLSSSAAMRHHFVVLPKRWIVERILIAMDQPSTVVWRATSSAMPGPLPPLSASP